MVDFHWIESDPALAYRLYDVMFYCNSLPHKKKKKALVNSRCNKTRITLATYSPSSLSIRKDLQSPILILIIPLRPSNSPIKKTAAA